jgi:hypothetical protein
MPTVTQRHEATQYDGTNGAALNADWLDGTYTLVSDDGSTLVLRDFEGSRKTIHLNDYLIRDANRSLTWYGNQAAYEAQWVVITP